MAARKRKESDPTMLMRQLADSLGGGELAPGYVLRGEERYFRDRAGGLLRRRAQELGYEVCVHDAERGNPDFSLPRATDDLSGLGLFGERRLVLIRSAGELLRKGEDGASSLARAALAFLASGGEAGTLVLSMTSLRADHAVAKAVVAAGGQILDLRKLWDTPPPWKPDPRQTELVRWALLRAREENVRLTPDQAVYVCAATGNDLAALDDALARLKHSGGEELEQVVGWDAATAPWNVAESLLDGDAPRALAGVEALFRSGFQEKSGRRLLDGTALAAMLTGSLARGIRRSLLMASELERGTDETDAAGLAGVHGRALAPALARARQRSARDWTRMLNEVSELERRAKSRTGVDVNDFALLACDWSAGRRTGASAR